MRAIYYSIDILAAIFITVPFVDSVLSLHKGKINHRILPAMLGVDIVMLLADAGRFYFADMDSVLLARLSFCICEIAYYAVLSLFVYDLTAYIAKRERVSKIPAIVNTAVCGVTAVFWCISAFNGMIYDIFSETRGSFYWVGQFGGLFMSMVQVGLQFKHRKAFKRSDFVIYLMFFLCPVIVFFVRSFIVDLKVMVVALSLSIFMLYEFVHLEQQRYARETERMLLEAKLSVIINQIRPHFLYNTLNSIYYLCEKDPVAAQSSIRDFASFLRGNMESIEATATVSFETELEHLEHYLNLEKLRFQDDLNIEFDLKDSNFQLPPLSVQMMVENAVKHGIEMKPNGGTVRISSWETPTEHLVSVVDDGVGFEPLVQPDGMGIALTRQRLETRCGGTLSIESSIGVGTTATLHIPKQKGETAK